MVMSDDFGLDDDDTVFIQAATQVEVSQHPDGNRTEFASSPRPQKRRRVAGPTQKSKGTTSNTVDHSESDSEHGAYSNSRKAIHRPTTQQLDSEDVSADDDDYYFPGELKDQVQAKTSKYRIHVPTNVVPFEDRYLTQTQAGLDSSPSRIRGAVWKKPSRIPSPAFPKVVQRDAAPTIPVGSNVNSSQAQMQQARSTSSNTVGRSSIHRHFSTIARPTRSVNHDETCAGHLQVEEGLVHQRRLPPTNAPHDNKLSIDISHELADLPSDAFSSSSPEKSPIRNSIMTTSQSMPALKTGCRAPQFGLKQMTMFGQPATQTMSSSQAASKKHAWPLKARDEPPTHHKLQQDSMKTWVYPTNLGTVRDYQYNIVSRSLLHNTLVALPTGLGKTFIAATVMLNYYRWTKDAQVVFMAPTKPLIAQQMEACYHIVGIPKQDTVLMTGETPPAARADEWSEKRVFFMTPQTVINDLKTGVCDPKRIVCIVVDEAHKATGSYAYTEVVAFVRRFNTSFRVLALTATPGSTVESVQAVIDHLGIARVELRTEQSLDIRQYTHEKHTENEVFEYNDEQALVMGHLSKAIKPVLDKLNQQNAYWSRDPMQLSAYGLTTARQKWMGSDAGRKATMGIKGMVNSIFTALSQLAHGISLLKNHGIGPFYGNALEFQRNIQSGQQKGKYGKQIIEHEDWVKMMNYIRVWSNNPDFIGHPKLQYLREVVLNHFLDAGEGRKGSGVPPAATRIMVFASYRDSTEEICRVLKRNDPMVRPHVFVGQQASKDSEGMNQKKQNETIQQFKAGKFNTLVATSIGEEGLDIGDVDLIVCYDASSSPIRMLQRIGRTGRKRVGRVVLLLMKGKEENDYAKAQDNYAYIQKTIADTSKYNYRDDQSPRILPKTAEPVVDKKIIDIPPENSQPIDLNEKSRRGKGKAKQKRPPKKFHMPDGVRTGFVTASKLDSNGEDDEDDASEIEPPARKRAKKEDGMKQKGIVKAIHDPELEPAQLPYLEDVLLSFEKQKDLERKYANTTADHDADLVIAAPSIDRFPSALRQPGAVKYIQHGHAVRAVARALQAVHSMDDDKLARWKNVLDTGDLQHDSITRKRLVSPIIAYNALDSVEEEVAARLQSIPRPVAKVAKGKQAVTSRKRQRSAVEAESGNEESEPEPTPANMRLGTQGIDLGSSDTSGDEDGDDAADSELDDFVVRSDQPLETTSSPNISQESLGLTQELRKTHKVGRRELQGRRKPFQIFSSEPGSDDDDADGSETEHLTLSSSNDISGRAAGLAVKRRRVVDESDSES